MKNKVIQKFFTILLGLMMVSPGWAATQYCQTEISNGSRTILMTCSPTENANEYQILFEGTDKVKITGINNANVAINDINGAAGGVALSFVLGTEGYGSARATFTKNGIPAAPYVAYIALATNDGEVVFNEFPKDMDWSATCSGGAGDLTDPELTITTPATDPYELALNGQLTVVYSTNSDATVTITSSSDAVTVNGTTLTAAKTGIATITVAQEATETYAAAQKTFTVKVPGDKSANTACSGWNDDIWASEGGYAYEFSTTETDVVLKITAIGEFPAGMAASPEILFIRRDGGDGIEGGGVVSGKTITWTFSKTGVLTRDGNPYLFNDNKIHFKPRIVRSNGVDLTNEYIYTVGEDCSGGGGDTPEPEPTGNLFNAASASISTFFAKSGGWDPETDSEATYDATTGKITTNIVSAKDGQWKAQVKLNTGLKTLDATKKIYFTCKIKPNKTFNGTTIKMFDNAEIYYENQSVSLTADTESTIILSGKNAVASSNGVIVFDFGFAPANTTIEIYDIEIGYGEIEDDSKPSTAPDAPTYPTEQVKAVYSATYGADCSFGHWNTGSTCTQEDYGKKFHTTGNGYFGLEFSSKNCSKMEALHLDVWFPEAGSFRVVPIWGGTEYGVTVTVTEAESKAWKSVDIPFTQGDWENITDWSGIYQIKIDNVPNKTFWLNNIYFYTTQEQEPEVITQTTWWDEIKIATINNVDYAVLCSVTRNTDKSLTFHMETSGWITGLVPQININNSYRNLDGYTDVNWKADYTTIPTDGTFETDDVLTCHLYFAYAGGSVSLTSFQYTVGAENEKPSIAVTGVTINQSAPKLAINEQLQLTATVTPSLVENKNVTWSSSSPTTVSVSETGMVTALAAGTATIRATSVADNTKYGEVLVTVQAALEDAVFYGNGYIERGEPAHLVAINYTITRTSERKLVYALDFSENVEGMVMQVKDAVAYNNLVLDETKMHATFTSTGTYTDGVKIAPEHFIYFGGPRVELGDYVIGSTNEQPNKLIALNEVVANTLTDDEVVDAVIARTFEAGNLYTLALPFDMDADQVEETFDACTMYALVESYWKVENENMYIRFAPVTEFEAGTPILFTPTEDIENAVAKEVTINNATCATPTDLVTFHGTYSKKNLDASNYILAADQYLYPVVGDEYYINGMRGYFSWGAGVSQAPKMARVILHEEITTDNALVPAAQGATKKVMENGRFVIIRDGKSYNAQGLIIQ